ncbi:DNA (cytosine-5-)-methyltransferase, partial [Streptomyces sp. NPDC014791]
GSFSRSKGTSRETSTVREAACDHWHWSGTSHPPPVAKALGEAIKDALLRKGEPQPLVEASSPVHDPVYKVLRASTRPLTAEQIIAKLAADSVAMDQPEVERRLNHLGHDFELEAAERKSGQLAYTLGKFKAFVGQADHQCHDLFNQHRAKIS